MCFFFSHSAFALWADGLHAFRLKDYVTAFNEFLPLAEKGDARAQIYLGFMFSQGYWVPQDYEKAALWYKKASDQDLAHAHYNLGSLYFYGQGVKKDYKKAFKLYEQAAHKGNGRAQAALSIMYRDGFHVSKDDKKAFFWCALAVINYAKYAKRMCEEIAQRLDVDDVKSVKREIEILQKKAKAVL